MVTKMVMDVDKILDDDIANLLPPKKKQTFCFTNSARFLNRRATHNVPISTRSTIAPTIIS